MLIDLEKQKLDLNVFVVVSMNVDLDKDYHLLMVALKVNRVDRLVWNDMMMLNLMDYYNLVANKNSMELLYSMIDDDREHIVVQERVMVE
jgi:hypothetical protein